MADHPGDAPPPPRPPRPPRDPGRATGTVDAPAEEAATNHRRQAPSEVAALVDVDEAEGSDTLADEGVRIDGPSALEDVDEAAHVGQHARGEPSALVEAELDADVHAEGEEQQDSAQASLQAEGEQLPAQQGDPELASEVDGGTASDPAQSETQERYYLNGERNYQVDRPGKTGITITDFDRPEDNILWEEKGATDAKNQITGQDDTQPWIAKHIEGKFASYQEAKQFVPGYENAEVGFDFTEPGVDPEFRQAVENAVDRLRKENPNTVIHLRWRER